jgi:23S rRNA (uracil1939-C5)-methyltransferase
MFLRPDAQRRAHEALARESLPPAVRDVPISTYAPGADLRYRTRARLQVRGGRGGVEVGFLAAHSHDLVAMRDCLVLQPSLEGARSAIAAWFEGAAGRGEARLALGAFPERRPVVDIAWTGELPASFYAAIDRARADGTLGGARVLLEGAARPALFGDSTPWMIGADGEPLELAPSGFGQAADEGNAILGARVRALVEPVLARDSHDSPIVELFAGAGNLTSVLARLSTRVLAVESDEAACAAARKNLEARALEAKITCKDADTFPIARGAHLVVLDPPRTGAKGACERIADARPRHVLYVSCDPPTLGRDLTVLLEKRFTPVAVELVELFPQTSHVETLVLLRHETR